MSVFAKKVPGREVTVIAVGRNHDGRALTKLTGDAIARAWRNDGLWPPTVTRDFPTNLINALRISSDERRIFAAHAHEDQHVVLGRTGSGGLPTNCPRLGRRQRHPSRCNNVFRDVGMRVADGYSCLEQNMIRSAGRPDDTCRERYGVAPVSVLLLWRP